MIATATNRIEIDRRIIWIIYNNDTMTTSTRASTFNSSTETPIHYRGYEEVNIIQELSYSLEELRKLINQIIVDEYFDYMWKEQFKRIKKIQFKSCIGMFLSYILHRRLLFSKSGFKGIKGKKYKN